MDCQSGKLDTEKDQKEDGKDGGEMSSNNGREEYGQGKLKTDRNGKIWRRATSSSGGTQPRYKVGCILTRLSYRVYQDKTKMYNRNIECRPRL